MKLLVKAGSTSKLARVLIQDSSSTTGAGLAALVFNSSGLKWSYIREDQATATVVTPATATLGTWTSGGFKEIDATNLPGMYEVGIPNAALASGQSVQMLLFGAVNMLPCPVEVELVAVDPQSNTAFVASVPAVVGSVASVTGNVGGNVAGSVASVAGNVGGSVASVTAAVAITSNVKKNQALNNYEFVMTDSTTHAPKTGLGSGVTATRSLDGGSFAACANAVAEVANGAYKINLDTTDMNANVVMMSFTATGADDLLISIITQP